MSRTRYLLLAPALAIAALLSSMAPLSAPSARSASSQISYANPLHDARTGQPISCPDPSVTPEPGAARRYVLLCTSNNATNAFPIWTSRDLVHWVSDGYIFPHGSEPSWAVPSIGEGSLGLYWAPKLYHFGGRWIVYFAAQYNPASGALNLPPGQELAPGTMVIGVGTASAIGGPWHTSIVHYRGQFNAVNGERERYGGVIDPSVVRDSRSGRLYLFWAMQQNEIWAGALSADGLTLDSHIHNVLRMSEPWECDPASTGCTLERPDVHYHRGHFYLFYSAASTWDSSYAEGVAASTQLLDPSHPFVKDRQPILVSGNGFLGPASSSHPVLGPDGGTYVFYHALTHPLPPHIHLSNARLLMLGRLNWRGFWPLINDGHAS